MTSLLAESARAAIERISPSPLQGMLVSPLSRMGLIALLVLQPVPLAGPRHTRQVPIRSCESSSGSTRNGAGVGIVSPSPPTSASVTIGLTPKETGVQAAVCEHP